jgi:hypothetical protein
LPFTLSGEGEGLLYLALIFAAGFADNGARHV